MRSFASFCMTACSSTSVCRLPFISACTSPAPAAIAAFRAESSGPPVATMRQAGKVELRGRGDPAHLRLRPEQHRHDQPGLGRLHRAGERLGATRVHHAGEHRLEPAAALQQPLQPVLRHGAPQPSRGRHDFQRSGGDLLAPPGRYTRRKNHQPSSVRFSRTTTCAVRTASMGSAASTCTVVERTDDPGPGSATRPARTAEQ